MEQINLIYLDRRILVTIKPSGILSTDEPGGMPELLRNAMGEPEACIRTVHRLDRVTSGLMVFARSRAADRILSEQVQNHEFQKKYLAVVHGIPPAEGIFQDLLLRDRTTRRTHVETEPAQGVQKAELSYRTLETVTGASLVEIALRTGRTHQIRVQFSARGFPLVGDRKYGDAADDCPLALWSCHLGFFHPEGGNWMEFSAAPPDIYPWNLFQLPKE